MSERPSWRRFCRHNLRLRAGTAGDIEENSDRASIIAGNIQNSSEGPRVAEPWFLGFDANVEFHLAMTTEDLEKVGPAIENAVRRFG